jgi:hypothetical protein
MRMNMFKALLVGAIAAAVLAIACGDDDGDAQSAAGGGVTIPVTTALLDSLPEYNGATLVREWLQDQGEMQIREFAVNASPDEAATAITNHFRDALLAAGWEEMGSSAAVSGFTKDGRQIVIGRVGPELQEPPSGATLLWTSAPPTETGFFFTIEAKE